MSRSPRIGVLALQGAVDEHLEALRRAGAKALAVRTAEELASVEGLVVPGGESTVISMLLDRYDLRALLAERLEAGMPAYGTCAGLILLARDVEEGRFPGLGCLDVTVRRNAFGRQVDSFECDLEIPAVGAAPFRGVFIRAPLVVRCGEGVEVLAEIPEGPVLVRQGRHLGGAFHPELTDDQRVHELFVRMVIE